jgi:hypothetical protein
MQLEEGDEGQLFFVEDEAFEIAEIGDE